MVKRALVLGGGAPNFTLMAGALSVCEELGFRFDVVSGAGAGGLTALVYLAPKGMTREEGLWNSVNLGISDPIWKLIPINYRVFTKGSGIAALFRQMLTHLPSYDRIMNQAGMTKRQKLISDLIQAFWSIITPTTVGLHSAGMCGDSPALMDMLDLEKLHDPKEVPEQVFLNAFCIEDHKMAIFPKEQITPKHVVASHAYPLIAAPTEIDGKHYIEGAIFDGFNFGGLLDAVGDIDEIYVFDIFGDSRFIDYPPNMWQAYGQQIVAPLISLTRKDLALFHFYLDAWNLKHKKSVKAIVIDFEVPEEWVATSLDWSMSNLKRCFKYGRKVMREYFEKNPPSVTAPTAPPPKKKTVGKGDAE